MVRDLTEGEYGVYLQFKLIVATCTGSFTDFVHSQAISLVQPQSLVCNIHRDDACEFSSKTPSFGAVV